jgi:SAM-dependent methyltransferase
MPYKNFILQNSSVTKYVGLDIENALQYDSVLKPDFTWNGIIMPFENCKFDCAFGTEVLEHCPKPEIVLKEVNRVLKPGGVFFFTVPFLWPLHEVPYDEFRYTPFSIKRLLEDSGFQDIEITATGGWHSSMAQMLGLWVRRAPMTIRKRNFLSTVLKPIIRKLIKMDKFYPIEFKEGQMITGLSGVAFK